MIGYWSAAPDTSGVTGEARRSRADSSRPTRTGESSNVTKLEALYETMGGSASLVDVYIVYMAGETSVVCRSKVEDEGGMLPAGGEVNVIYVRSRGLAGRWPETATFDILTKNAAADTSSRTILTSSLFIQQYVYDLRSYLKNQEIS